MKPLFIPLMADYFDRFKAGTKRFEYRRFGPRWNFKTCVVGRDVVLSRGYGRRSRLVGQIVAFSRVIVDELTIVDRDAVRALYGERVQWIAKIELVIEGEA